MVLLLYSPHIQQGTRLWTQGLLPLLKVWKKKHSQGTSSWKRAWAIWEEAEAIAWNRKDAMWVRAGRKGDLWRLESGLAEAEGWGCIISV